MGRDVWVSRGRIWVDCPKAYMQYTPLLYKDYKAKEKSIKYEPILKFIKDYEKDGLYV